MKTQKTNAPASPRFWPLLVLLAVVLGVLFWRSFLPGMVHFSNDGPLGQQNTAASRLPQAYFGIWNDNNDIGSNGGAWSLSLSSLFRWFAGPVGYSKFLVPFSLFVLGLGAWSFLRQLKLAPLAVLLGSLAALLNSTFFSTACWGVAPQEIAIGMDFFAVALIVSIHAETPLLIRLCRLALAGLCVGMNVMEAADIGAIFSLFVSAFALATAWNQENGKALVRLARGAGNVAIVAVFAGFIASQTVVSLVGTQIQGVAGTSQDADTKARQWDFATMWSLPKKETLGLFMPGVFGYKMDTPINMDTNFEEYYMGGNYWGAMGMDPAWDRWFASGSKGDPPAAQTRQTGGQQYAGVLVVLLAVWAMTRAWRRSDAIYDDRQRRYIWFWSVVVILAILFAWGRFSVFYGLLYKLPYFSTIRSPTKFVIVFSWGIVVLFAYGIHGHTRLHPEVPAGKPVPPLAQFKSWWASATSFDRKWTWGCLAALAASLLGWMIYAGEKPVLVKYLGIVGFPTTDDNPMGAEIATFSIHQAGWFVVLFAIAILLSILVISGVLAGRLAKFGGFLLVLFLVADMWRANLPFINHLDYMHKYDIDPQNAAKSTNPILNFLMDKPYEHRVSQLPFMPPPGLDSFGNLYTIEWMQHQFPYYNIQSLDNWQRPRVPQDIEDYENAVYFGGNPQTLPRLTREWQLTNTRYIFGPAGFIDPLNSQVDPVLHRFRIAERFSVVPKPGVVQATQYADLTAVPDTNGNFAMFEFTGALPRAKVYSNWQVNTNNQAVLSLLGNPDFDPAETVLVDTPQPGLATAAAQPNTGTVDYVSYTPTKIVLTATNSAPAVLLLNDKFDPGWSVTVDGRTQPVLRCNFIMRGVALEPGTHTVEFSFSQATKFLGVTIAAYVVAGLLAMVLLVTGRRSSES